jgi:hypothetical protein
MVGSCSIQNGQGVCSYIAAPDGSACNDGNACHQGGTCQAGACSASPIVCGGAAQCNPQTGACSSASTVPPLFTNGDFVGTAGVAPPSPWTVTIGSSGGGFNGPIPQSYSNLNLTPLQPGQGFGSFLIPGTNIIRSGFDMLTLVESAAGGPFSQTDSNAGSGISWPRYGNQAVIVNQGSSGGNFNTLSQTATVTAANFDPADSKVHIRFAFAPVVGRGLGSTIDPYYFIQVTNVTQGTILYTDFGTAGNGNQPWQTATNSLDFTPWQLVSVAESAPAINVGDSIELQIVAACDGDEYGDGALTKVWVDGVGANVPGISVEGSAQANAGTGAEATYTLNYQNQGAQTETNVTVNFTLPANTIYESLNAPYGATCTNPNIGANGTVSCNVGSLAPGATGSLSITVAFPNAAIAALPYRNYGISSDQETTLLGPPISVAGLGVASVVYGEAAGSGSDIVSAPAGAAWSASTNSSWINLTNGSGTGAGLVTFTYSANAGATRTGTITLSASTFQLTLTITQAGASYAQTSQLNTVVSTTTGLGQPYGVAVDSSGNLYIADNTKSAIEKWNSTNGLTTLFALTSSSNPSNDLSSVGVTLDGLGNVYAAFHSSSLYRSIYEWNPISATAEGLQIPQTNARAVTVDNGGDLYIANTSEMFEWLPSAGVHYKNLDGAALGVAVDLAGNVYESLDGTGVKELPVSGQSSVLFYPGTDLYGLAVDGAGNVYAATQGATPSIVQWNPVTNQTTTLVSTGLSTPQGIAVDGTGNVYIADSGSSTIYELPYAFVPTASVTETAAAGSDQLLPVLPATAPVTAASDSSWLTIGTITNGVVSFSLTQNVGTAARTAHISILGQSIPVTQSGQVPGSISINGGNNQTVAVNSAFPVNLSVVVKDAASNPIVGATVTFTAPSTGASGTFANSTNTLTTVTNASGIAAASQFTANANGGGPYNVTAAAGSLSTPFSLTNTFLTQSIQNFGTVPTQAVGTPLTLTATATSGLAVSYQSNTQTVCTVSASTVTFLTPGQCSITAGQGGSNSYSAATSITQQFTVNPNTPTISNLQAVAVGGNSEVITWNTDQPSTSQVTYGATTTPLDSNLVTFHSVTLTGLAQNTAYTYQVSSTNSTNGTVTSPNGTFTTTPFVGYVAFWGVNNSGITISWSTDFAATTFVAYGTTTALGQASPVQSALSNGHGVVLTGLNPGTTYYFRAESTDSKGHTGASTLYNFTTTGQPASPAPVITNVTVTNITTTGATISWTTDQAATTQVNYGTTTSYGSSSALNSILVTSHSVTLTGLTPGTLFDYDVVSTNSSGTSSGMSTNYTFTTTNIIGTPPAITNIQTSVTSTTATISWTTDQAANSAISGTVTKTPDSTYVTSHSVTLTGLTAGTTYNFSVVSTNAGGLTTTSPTSSFTTTAANSTAPFVGYVAFWGVNNSGVTISWSTDLAANTQLNYGTTASLGTLTPLQGGLTNSHGVVLTGLASGTTYYFVAQSTGANGATGYSTTYSFTTTGSPSAPAPNISNIQTSVTTTSATITWTTDEAASSQVNYGVTTAYSLSSTLNTNLSTTHSVTLTGLMPGTTYDFDVMSANINGTSSTSSNSTFQTAGSAPGPVITSVAASSITSSTALITWTTDQASTSVVNYGQTVSSATLVTSHSVALSGLTPNTTYTFSVTSVNAGSVSTTSSSYTFTTSTASAAGPVISYVAYWGITSSGITISWSTNVPSNTSVAYGTTNALTSVTPVQTALSNSHGVTLTGLKPGTLYYFQAQSADVNGNTGTSTVYSFTTLAGGTPIISNVLVTPGSGNTATVSWTTSAPTYSYVQYGPSSGNYNRYSPQSSLTASPNVSLGFVPSGTVYYQLVSTDANGDEVVSAEATFIEP